VEKKENEKENDSKNSPDDVSGDQSEVNNEKSDLNESPDGKESKEIANDQKDADVDKKEEDSKAKSVELQIKYYTKIFQFEDGFRDKVKSFDKYAFDGNFRQTIQSFVPITQHETLVRIDDVQFKRKKTIELLYSTGYNADGQPQLNHFMFLRRVLLCSVRSDITTDEDR
jgi:hypothetical protein